MKYWIERMYPYVLAFVGAFALQRVKNGVMSNGEFNDLLGNLVTLNSIVIGFFGAIMPVILSMKNESKFVKYVFENDTEGLFAKYLKITIFSGLASALFSLSLYVRDSFEHVIVKDTLYTLWVFFTMLFAIYTYRSLSHMISLVFSKDKAGTDSVGKRIKTQEELKLQEKYKE